MAKTRSQKSKEKDQSPDKHNAKLSQNLKQKQPKQKKTKQKKSKQMNIPIEFNCSVRLTRLSQSEITIMLHGITENYKFEPKKYDLRKRSAPREAVPVKTTNNVKTLVAASQMAFYTAKAIRIWDDLKKKYGKNQISLQDEQIVCARMAGHRPWPSKVLKTQKNGVKLYFYGTHEPGIVKRSEIVPYEFCHDVIEQYLKAPTCNVNTRTLMYHLSFVKACKELTGENVEAESCRGDERRN